MMGGEEELGLAMVRPPPPSFAVMMKLLLSNEQCGALIGKGGATVVGLQDRFGTTLKLGGPDDLFPGTFFRPAVIRGTVGALRGCMEAIITVLWQDFCSRNKLDARTGYGAADGGGMEDGRGPAPPFRAEFTFRLLVPHNASGAVIGKGGKVVRAISEETGAHIKLSSNDDGLTGIPERSIILTGHRDPVHAAACRIFDVLASEMRNLVYAVPGVSYNLAAVYAGGGGGPGGVPGAGAAPGGGHGGGGGGGGFGGGFGGGDRFDRGGDRGVERGDRGYERGHYDGGAPAGGGGAYARGFASGGGGGGSYGGHGPAGYSSGGGPGPRGREAGGGGYPGAHHPHPHHPSSHRGGAPPAGPAGYGGSGGFGDVLVGTGRDGGAASVPQQQQPSAYPSSYTPRDREGPPAAATGAAAWYPGGGGERRDRSGSGAGPAGGGWAPPARGSGGGDAGSYAGEGGGGYAPHGRSDAPDPHHLHRGGDRFERSGGYPGTGAGSSAAAAGGSSGPYGLAGPLPAGAAGGASPYSIGPAPGYGGAPQPSPAALAAAAAAAGLGGLGGLPGLPGLVDAYGRPIPLPANPYAGLYGGPASMLLGQGLQDAYSIHAAALAAAAATAGLGLPPHGGLPGGGHASLPSLPAHGGEEEGSGSGGDSGGSAFAPTQVRRPGGGAHPPQQQQQQQQQRRDSHDGQYSGSQYRPQQQQAQGGPATPSYGPQSAGDASPSPLLQGPRGGGAPGLQQHTGIASHASHSIGSASQGSSGASLHSTGSAGTASTASRVSLASAGGSGSGSRLASAPGLSSSSRALLQSVAEHGPPPREEGPPYGYAGGGGGSGAGGAGAAPRFSIAPQHTSLRNVLPSLSAGNAMGGGAGGGHGGLLDAGAKAAATGHTQRGSSDTALVRPQDAAQSSYLRALLAQHAAAGAADPGAGTGLLPMGAGTGLLGGDSGAGLGFGHGDGSPSGAGDAPRFLARGVGDEVFRAHRLLGASGASVSIETATVHVPVAAGGGGGEHSEHGDPEGADMGAATSMVAQLALGQR